MWCDHSVARRRCAVAVSCIVGSFVRHVCLFWNGSQAFKLGYVRDAWTDD
jgi:hypothetical protein|eukprot:COSAG06_NODE_246_length_19169_cov_28.627950_11_plen_50_part_00